MVLYKRKPITYSDPPPNLEPNTEVWTMRGSNEVFTSYDTYLERYDFYSQKHFTDAVNGKTGMSYFEALESESTSANDIERVFPEALRGPILRHAQFSEVGRMNDLVDHIFAAFKNDFFPGEEVSVVLDNADTMDCVVREKASFPELRNADGTIQRPGFSRYFVKIKDTQEQALLDDGFMKRGKNVFTKQNVRSFLKNCLQREPWVGAPWLVKESLAQKYRLPMIVPAHLTQEAKIAQLKQQSAQRENTNGKPRKQQKSTKIGIDQLLQADIEAQVKSEEAKVQVPKYPCDDLDVEIQHNGKSRPQLKYLAPLDGSPSPETGLRMSSVGPLLELWNAFTVHWDRFGLEPFSFDEFLDAMRFSSSEVPCELLDEVHCAVFKLFINEAGEIDEHLEDTLPGMESEDETTVDTPDHSTPATPVEPTPRSRRSRLSHVQNISSLNDHTQSSHQAGQMLGDVSWEQRISKKDFADGGWQVILVGVLAQLSHSDIWSARVLPVLAHLAPPNLPPTRLTALEQYTTLDVNHRITALGILAALSFCTHTVKASFEARNEEMTAIRKRKVDMQRKRKDHLRDVARLELDRRENNPDAFADDEDEDKKDHVDTPLTNGLPSFEASFATNGAHSDVEEDEEPPSRALRRSNNARKRKRDEEAVRREAERLERLSKQKDAADKVKKYRRILKDIDTAKAKVADCEMMIEDFDDRLREMNIARMKSLGRDRFWGRWWWFERVGMQLDGKRPAASSKKNGELANDGYANARLWVQGPMDAEREGFVDVNLDDARAYTARHGMTPADRKVMQEGPHGVTTAQQWGYYDTGDDVEALIGWLDDRGTREKDLKKELLVWREEIVQQMETLRSVLHPVTVEDASSDGDEDDRRTGPRTRVSTRNRTYLDTDDVDKRWRCLKWHNTRAPTRSGRHCETSIKAERSTTKRGGKKGVAHPRLPPEAAPTLQRKAVSSRSGQSGRGIAQRVASGRAAHGMAKMLQAERDFDFALANEPDELAGGKTARETRGVKRQKLLLHEDEDDDDDDGRVGVRTRRSGRGR